MNNRTLIYGLVVLILVLGFLVLQSPLLDDLGLRLSDTKNPTDKKIKTISAEEFARLLKKTQSPHSHTGPGPDTEGRDVEGQNRNLQPNNRPDSSVVKRWKSRFEPATIKLLKQLDIKPLSPKTEPPTFSLTRLSGERIRLSHFRNNWLLLNFWATWCMPCREEMPSLNRLNERYSESVKILGVNIGEKKTKVSVFSNKYDINFPLFLDHNGRIASFFGTKFLPETWFIGPKGKIMGVAKGPRDWSSKVMFELFSNLTNER
jgi:thiol-disulfide isomerase/thioredoxin